MAAFGRSVPKTSLAGRQSAPGHTDAVSERHYWAACTLGLEAVLADELTALGAGGIAAGHGGVAFTGDQAIGQSACLWLRSALRVQEQLAEATVHSREELYGLVRSIDWSRSLTNQQTLAVEGAVKQSFASDGRFPLLVVKDAVCDQFRERTGERPSVDKDRPDLRIRLTMQGPAATLSRDLAGSPLHERGYRAPHRTALNEATAAGLLLHTGWDRRAPLCDPMCGSATFLIEAAWLARDRAPGLGRRFAFEGWPDADAATWRRLQEEAEARAARGAAAKVRLAGNDRHAGALAISRQALAAAGVADTIELRHGDCADYVPPFATKRVLCNPPYGGRALDDDAGLAASWRALGQFLAAECEGATAWVFCGNAELARHTGLCAGIKMPVKNGAIDSRWLCYEIDGSE